MGIALQREGCELRVAEEYAEVFQKFSTAAQAGLSVARERLKYLSAAAISAIDGELGSCAEVATRPFMVVRSRSPDAVARK